MDACDAAELQVEMEQARGEGYRARMRAPTETANPYEDEPLASAWRDGWELADRRAWVR